MPALEIHQHFTLNHMRSTFTVVHVYHLYIHHTCSTHIYYGTCVSPVYTQGTVK